MMDLFIGTAYAQAAGAPAQGGQTGQLILMFAIFAGIWYWLIIRPQNKRISAHAAMVSALKKGDRVVTSSGMHGRIVKVEENAVVLDVAKNVQITFDKVKISRTESAGTPDKAQSEKK